LVLRSCEPWTIYFGVPAKAFKRRRKDILSLAQQFEQHKKE